MITGYQPAQENTLPLAQTNVSRMEGASSTAGPLVAVQPGSDGMPTRSLVLWGILLAGVLVLALMAWALLRQTRGSAEPLP